MTFWRYKRERVMSSVEASQIRSPTKRINAKGSTWSPSKPWTGADGSGESLCMHCDMNRSCWKLHNEKPGAETPGDPPARG